MRRRGGERPPPRLPAGRTPVRSPRVHQFQTQPLRERSGRGHRTGAAGRVLGAAVGFGPDPHLHAVRVTHPQRCRGAVDAAGDALGRAGVGGVVVVGLEVLPAGPGVGAGRTGADLDAAVQLDVRVVPDHTGEGEVPYVPAGQALFVGRGEGEVAGGEGRQGQRLGAAGGFRARRRSHGSRGHRSRRDRGRGEGQGEGGRAGDADRGSK